MYVSVFFLNFICHKGCAVLLFIRNRMRLGHTAYAVGWNLQLIIAGDCFNCPKLVEGNYNRKYTAASNDLVTQVFWCWLNDWMMAAVGILCHISTHPVWTWHIICQNKWNTFLFHLRDWNLEWNVGKYGSKTVLVITNCVNMNGV
jgi:hypothetical protein